MKVLIVWGDPEFVGPTKEERDRRRCSTPSIYMHELCQPRSPTSAAPNPAGDLFTSLVQAEVDGERLTDHEIGSFFVPAHDRRQRHHPAVDQPTGCGRSPPPRAARVADGGPRGPDATAVEEIVRWATPIMTFRRTASRDCELDGVQITKGDKVVHVLQLGQPRRVGASSGRTSSTSRGTPTRTSASAAAASTTAWATSSPGSSSARCSPSCSPAAPTSWPASPS